MEERRPPFVAGSGGLVLCCTTQFVDMIELNTVARLIGRRCNLKLTTVKDDKLLDESKNRGSESSFKFTLHGFTWTMEFDGQQNNCMLKQNLRY